ncbi:MAG: hypothetical protein KME30_27965 [Iphinoe sp. HA4291-MV1]|jgi:hypothetical protein|nr:hypothetical protein [Iphinoe sp. HA4291-MV1]
MERQHQSKTKNAIAQRLQRRIASNNRESTIPRNYTHPIEELQGAIGNRAVNRLLANQPVVQAKPMNKRSLTIHRYAHNIKVQQDNKVNL